MKLEIKKISKIIDEIITYFMYTFDCPQYDISFEKTESAFFLHFAFHNAEITDKALEQLRSKLVVKRNPELENYYWQLTGESQDNNEMALVSMMSDDIKLEYEGKTIILHLRRNR